MQWVSCLKMSYPSWWPWQFGDRWLKFSFLFPQLYQDFCTQGTLCSFLCLEIHSTWAVKQIQVVFCQNPWQRWYRILFLSFFIQPRLWPRQLRTTKLSKMTWPCKLWAIFSVGESKKCCSWLSAKSMVHCFFWKLWESYNQRPNMYPK